MMLNIQVCALFLLTHSLVAFDTNITGPGKVAVGTTYNVTCTLNSSRGRFFRNNIYATDTVTNDTSGRCYVTNSSKYQCSYKSITEFYREFQLEVPTDFNDVGGTEWYCSDSNGKSNTIFVDVFEAKGHNTSGPGYQKFKWSETNIALIVGVPVFFIVLIILVICIIKVVKSKKKQAGQPEMINSLYNHEGARCFGEMSSILNTASSTDPSHTTSSPPQTGCADIYDSIQDIRNSLTESREALEEPVDPPVEFDPQKIYSTAKKPCDLSTSQV